MAYVPPSQQPDAGGNPGGGETTPISSGSGGYTPPSGSEGGGYNAPPEGGGYTPPTEGGSYTPPASTDPYTTPTSGAGGFNPPPTEGPGYGSQAGGGYTQPVSGSGGYTPPAGGGYTPPPAGGGYTPPTGGGGSYTPPPPPPVGGGGGFGGPPPPMAPTGAGANDFSHLLQSYINALTKPNAATYEGEVPNASWAKVLIGVAAVAVVQFIMSFIAGASATAAFNQISGQLGSNADTYRSLMNTSTNPVWALVGTFITFFLGAGLLYLLAKILGGQGNDFMLHSYLLSISYTPMRIIAAVLNIIPCVGTIVSLALYLYQLYSAGLSMQVSQRMESGRAQLAAFLGLVVVLVLGCLCAVVAGAALVSILGGVANTTTP